MESTGIRVRAARLPLARIGLYLLVGVLLVVSVASFVARAPPPTPMTTQGNAYDGSSAPLAPGTLIRTFLDGVDYSNDTLVSNAQGAYSIATDGNLVFNATTPEPSPGKWGANLGELILYAAGSFATQVRFFQEVVAWHPDLTVTQDLHLGSAATTPEPLRIQGLVTQPAQGGPQYVTVCNPTAASVPLADYYLQVDRPGTYYGGNLTLTGVVAADSEAQVNLTSPFALNRTGDALKLVYRNRGGPTASAGGQDLVVDRVEFNATTNGTLYWQPGNTTLGNAPAPGPGQILERSPFCSPAPAPGAFVLATEPGLPAAGSPTVTILSPTAGQTVQGGQTTTIRWNMTDPVFVGSYLRVWVNVTVQGTTTTLIADALGATSVDWSVPDVGTSGAVVNVSVVNPFGANGSAETTFTILPSTPYSAYIAILVVVVIAVFVLLAFFYARRQERPPPSGPPPVMPAAPPPVVESPAAPVPASAPAAVGTKACPKCGTVVKETDDSCFFCGHLFVTPPR